MLAFFFLSLYSIYGRKHQIQTRFFFFFSIMALLVNKKGTAGAVLLAAAVMAILLLLYAASYMVSTPPRAASRRQYYGHAEYYRTYLVILRKPPNADAMDEDAHRRWHESFLPTTVIGYSGEPRLLDSYYRYVRYGIYAFSARLTFAEIEDVAKKPGVLGSRHCPPKGVTTQCTMCQADDWDCGALVVSKPAATASQK